METLEDELAEKLEHAYLTSCREIGQLFLDANDPLSAWRYLRPTGDKHAIRQWLACASADENNADELIELALYEGIDPERGFAWLLARSGTCQSITQLEAIQAQLSIPDQTACAAVLLRHVHQELLANLRGHAEQLGDVPASANTALEYVTALPQLIADGNFHIDTSHLATTVRYARLLTEPGLVELAIDLAEYGSRLAEDHQYPGEPPFEQLYPTHMLLFRATLGQEVDAAVEYFGQRARDSIGDSHSTTAIETYLVLLQRIGRGQQALEEYVELVPKGCELSLHAPDLMSLARQQGSWQDYFAICQSRDDLVGYAAGLLAERE